MRIGREKISSLVEEMQEAQVVLRDMKEDGVVLFTTSSNSSSTLLRRCGFCLSCHKTLTSYAAIFVHQKEYPNHFRNFFGCPTCRRTFIGREEYERHLQLHVRGKFSCDVCQKEFSNDATLHRHRETHNDALRLKTVRVRVTKAKNSETHQEIGQKKDRRNYFRHLATLNGKARNKCNICGYSCLSVQALKVHKLLHRDPAVRRLTTNTKMWECSCCATLFRSKATLKMHLQMKHSLNLFCELCDKTFTTETSFDHHLNTARCGGAVNVVSCDLCNDAILDLEYTKRRHLVKVHGAFLKCRICPTVFKTATTLHDHYKSMHPFQKNMFDCKNCGDIFLEDHDRVKHFKWCISGRRSFGKDKKIQLRPEKDSECNLCQRKFPNLQELQSHLFAMECQSLDFKGERAQMHNSTNDLSSPNSSKNGDVKKQLSTAEKRTQLATTCGYCQMQLKNKLQLNSHMWRHHSQWGEKKLPKTKPSQNLSESSKSTQKSSDITGKTKSVDSTANTDVITTVTDTSGTAQNGADSSQKKEKNFSCLECGKKFWKGSTLEAHIERRHSQKAQPLLPLLPKPWEETVVSVLGRERVSRVGGREWVSAVPLLPKPPTPNHVNVGNNTVTSEATFVRIPVSMVRTSYTGHRDQLDAYGGSSNGVAINSIATLQTPIYNQPLRSVPRSSSNPVVKPAFSVPTLLRSKSQNDLPEPAVAESQAWMCGVPNHSNQVPSPLLARSMSHDEADGTTPNFSFWYVASSTPTTSPAASVLVQTTPNESFTNLTTPVKAQGSSPLVTQVSDGLPTVTSPNVAPNHGTSTPADTDASPGKVANAMYQTYFDRPCENDRNSMYDLNQNTWQYETGSDQGAEICAVHGPCSQSVKKETDEVVAISDEETEKVVPVVVEGPTLPEMETPRELPEETTEQASREQPNDAQEQPEVVASEQPSETPNPKLSVSCFICDQEFNRINSLLHHLKTNHN